MIIDDYSNPHEIETYRVMTSLVGFVFSILSCFFFLGCGCYKGHQYFLCPQKGGLSRFNKPSMDFTQVGCEPGGESGETDICWKMMQ